MAILKTAKHFPKSAGLKSLNVPRENERRYDGNSQFDQPEEKRRRCAYQICKTVERTECNKFDVGLFVKWFADYHYINLIKIMCNTLNQNIDSFLFFPNFCSHIFLAWPYGHISYFQKLSSFFWKSEKDIFYLFAEHISACKMWIEKKKCIPEKIG